MVDVLPLAWGVVGMFVLATVALFLLPVSDGFVSGPGHALDPRVPIKTSSMDRLIAFFDRPVRTNQGYGERTRPAR